MRVVPRQPWGSFIFTVRYRTIANKRVVVLVRGYFHGNKSCKETAKKLQRTLA